jgi:hypothetical protein
VGAGGFQPMGNGNGNGSRPRTNAVKRSALYEECREAIEARYPRLIREKFFPNLETYMVICDVEDRAAYLGGFNFLLNTPDDFEPAISLYFTYANGTVVLQAAHAE